MSRSGYTEGDDCDEQAQWAHIRWRGAVKSAFRGKRGQAFLREMLAAMDALPEKKLIAGDLIDHNGCACALGTVAIARGLDIPKPDPMFDDYEREDFWEENTPGFGIADAMAKEIMWENDEGGDHDETPEHRYARVRRWIERQLVEWEPAT
jgi:hypothetical protein